MPGDTTTTTTTDTKVDILLVDDRPENLLALEATLSDLGQNLVKASSGAEALRLLLNRDFAVILLDVQMPGMDGFECASLIRARERSRTTPIIFVTAFHRTDTAVARGYGVGAVDFLFKPLVPEILKSKVAAFVELHRKTEQVKRQAEQIAAAQRREHERELADQRQRWESERLREEMERERRRSEELSRINDELSRARDAAEIASRTKSQFLANMSHELRTPLNAIIGYSEMLREEAADVGVKEFVPDLERIHAAGKHLLALINDILDLSKIEAGKMELYVESFDVADVVDDVAVTVQPLVAKNRNRLEVRVPGDVGVMRADLTKLRQSLFNLLSNAAKFTEDGTITLTVERAREGGRGEEFVEFHVADTGIGIDPAHMARLFEAFTQANAETTRKYGGTGLGLSITRRFCQMMGGDVMVESEVGRGSTFTIRVPARVADAGEAADSLDARRATVASAVPPPAPDAPLVLAIDDDPVARDLAERLLTTEGYRVATAADGREGLRLARELKPSAITLDVMMPTVDGWAVLSSLKADPATAGIPVIMVTMTRDRHLGYALGAADLLVKPVDRERLTKVLRRHAPACARVTDESCRVLVVDDDPTVRDLLRPTFEKEGWVVDEAENGDVALRRLAEARPDLILLDLMMPAMDGFDFAARVRADEQFRGIPIVVMTAKDLTEADRRRLNGHVAKVLQKDGNGQAGLLQAIKELTAAVASPEAAAAGAAAAGHVS